MGDLYEYYSKAVNIEDSFENTDIFSRQCNKIKELSTGAY